MALNQSAVVGTSALELERLGTLPEIPTEESARPRQRREVQELPRQGEGVRVRTRAKTARQTVSKFGVLGYAVVGIMLIMIVLVHIQLATVSAETVELESQMAVLQEESDRLQIAYESAFNQAAVEQYAKDVLGMTDQMPGQVYYIGSDLGDEAEIISQEEPEDYGILGTLADMFASLMEYFRFD